MDSVETIMHKNENLKKKKKNRAIYFFLAAFFVPLLIMIISYAVQEVYPFGDRHILTVDLFHQYAPFLRELRNKIITGDSLFYTWTGGLGFNFFAVITYYLASPFNLLLLFFKDSQLSDAVLLITILKIASASLSFYIYAYKKYRRHDLFQLAISFAYSLSAYSIAYSWNIMWLDTIVLLPIVILGLNYLIQGKSAKIYIISLSLILITNYYTAFFACIFIFFYYFVLYVDISEENKINFQKNKHKGRQTFLKFGGYSLFSAAIAAITLLPTAYALMETSAVGDTFPDSFSFFEPFIDYISRLLILAPLSIRDGMPNIYMGVIVLLFVPYFFMNNRISLKRKYAHSFLLFFLMVSLNNNVLNYIWHGLHYPNQLPFRNSFVLVFLLCQMTLDSYKHWSIRKIPFVNIENEDLMGNQKLEQKYQKSPWVILFSICLLVLLLLQKIDLDTYSSEMIISSILLLFIYAVILNSAKNKGINRSFISVLLFIIMTMELLMNSIIGINFIADNEYYGMRDGYKAGEYADSIHQRVEQIKDNNINSRAALWPDKTVNDPMLYGYPGLTIFASTYREEPVEFFENLGYDSNSINSYQNTGSNIIMDSILGIEYKITAVDRDEQISFYNLIDEDDQTILYQNPYVLPMIYAIPDSAVNINLNGNISALKNQKSLIQAFSGNQDMLEIVDPKLSLGLGNQIGNLSGNKYSVKKESDYDGERYFSFDITAEEAGYYTLSWQTNSLKFSTVNWQMMNDSSMDTINNDLDNQSNENTNAILSEVSTEKTQLSRKDNSLSDIGYLEKNQTVRVTFTLSENSSDNGNITVEAARINQDLFESFIRNLKENSVNPEYIKANHLEANITMPKSGYVLMTSTYDSSWKAKVNGKKVKIESFDDALILIPVEEGENFIDMEFIPRGFKLGASISVVSLITGITIDLWFRRKKQKNHVNSDDKSTIKQIQN